MDCKHCGAPLNQGAVLCQECGTRQRRRAGAVRCAKCHKMVSLGLTVCPHCGRNVQPAGPRWGLWVVSFIALILVGLWAMGELPIARVVQEAQAVRARLSGWVQVLGPVNLSSPASVGPTATPVLLALVTEVPSPTALSPSPTPLPEVAISEATETSEVSALSEELNTPAPTGQATVSPTELPTATPTPEPTFTPTATPTVTPLPPTATPTATKPVASGTTTYRVQSGDTLSSIAARFGIAWEALAAANGLTSRSVLRIGQELIVPAAGAPLPPTATPLPRPTATPVPPIATPLPQLAAPELLDPGDQAGYSGKEAFVILTWQPVAGMSVDSQYQIVVSWVEQGVPQEHRWFWNTAGTQVPPWLWGKADQPARKYTWYVRVVQVTTDGQGGERVIPLSPPSQSRVFYWG